MKKFFEGYPTRLIDEAHVSLDKGGNKDDLNLRTDGGVGSGCK